jgi:uncharacterized surface protein with fasciclin (FAS1) repeats
MLKKVTLALITASIAFATPAMAKKPEPLGTIVDIVVDSDDHTILEDLVIAFGLAGMLSGDDKYTVFAPTDEAFGNIAAVVGTLEDCQIEEILAYHVTEGRRFSNSVVNRNNPKWITMYNGGFTTSTPSGTIIDTSDATDGLELDGGPDAMIVGADLAATNGVVHSINQVLIPDTFADCVADD